ncbi:MAG: SDR family NAD(P)-dependent oxidoreductase [Bacteroidetes bacterium]|nr:SDR family NAD(P)-dependent oxidoreductase [Bacteroidota bacterium]MDA1267512.1 SDR family NAD(P)-dependent oxidoreductase [Bacteroidota bacterium]
MNPTLIVLTGAASGIGKQLLYTFLERKVPLILVDLDACNLENLVQGQESVFWVDGDVALQRTWERVLDTAENSGFPISHLINCAGVIRPGFVDCYALEDIDFHLNCNAKGSILGTTVVGRAMKKQGFGHILNISSLAGLAPVSGLSLYVASKFAVRGFSLSVAAELKRYGVSVSVICPDLVNTPMLDLQLGYPEEAKLTFSGPKRVLEPKEVVQIILQIMERPRMLVCIPESRGLLAKIVGAWPWIGELFRKSLEKKGEKAIQSWFK